MCLLLPRGLFGLRRTSPVPAERNPGGDRARRAAGGDHDLAVPAGRSHRPRGRLLRRRRRCGKLPAAAGGAEPAGELCRGPARRFMRSLVRTCIC